VKGNFEAVIKIQSGDRMDIRSIIKEYKELLVTHYEGNLKEVILYGSAARGEYGEESDIDVLVILKTISNYSAETATLLKTAMLLEKKYDDVFLISALPALEEDYRSRITPLFLNVRKEGVPL